MAAALAVKMEPNYLDMSAPFHFDARYSRYEDIERSYADLDSRLAKDDGTLITVNADILSASWMDASSNVDTSLSHHLRPAQMDEAHFFQEGVLEGIEHYHGQVMQMKVLFHTLRKEILGRLRDEYLTNGMQHYMDNDALQRLQQDEELVPLRPGFGYWMDRVLNRVLMFQVVRACNKYHDPLSHFLHSESNPEGWHRHGDRHFFVEKTPAI
ncbi:hypothetical protein PRZ48_005178 [Zasmidium cellare]|uniref:Uncharacterized protein n=1 Tax=Zasmidium cellare TaxID=395010 RepID=A0ABR0ERZ8_ZASCE|nr:hypothetical protein PRZ48_005178 [Zasmidium cellare]